MTYLTDQQKTNKQSSRSDAHDLTAELAQLAWNEKRPFLDVLLENEEITGRLDEETIREISNPIKYVGKSEEIIQTVYDKYHGQQKFRFTQ